MSQVRLEEGQLVALVAGLVYKDGSFKSAGVHKAIEIAREIIKVAGKEDFNR